MDNRFSTTALFPLNVLCRWTGLDFDSSTKGRTKWQSCFTKCWSVFWFLLTFQAHVYLLHRRSTFPKLFTEIQMSTKAATDGVHDAVRRINMVAFDSVNYLLYSIG